MYSIFNFNIFIGRRINKIGIKYGQKKNFHVILNNYEIQELKKKRKNRKFQAKLAFEKLYFLTLL